MKNSLLVAATFLGLGLAVPAHAQSTTLDTSDVQPLDASGEPSFDDGTMDDAQPIQQPATTAPTDTPQLPAKIPPPPGAQQAQQQAQQAQQAPVSQSESTTGQWVYTQQYGWVYAPYDQTYTYVTDDVSNASMYVYRPVSGWAWLGAPWVVSVGPRPYWGNYGPYRYAYYSHPWFRVRPHYGSAHYYGRPSYSNHNAPGPRAHYYYRANPGGGYHGRGGGWHGGGRHR